MIKFTKTKFLLYSFVSSFLLFSCSTNITGNSNEYKTESNKTEIENKINFDLGSNNKSTFSVKLSFSKNKTFSTKNSSNGIPQKTKSNIQLLRLYLVNSNAISLSDSNIKSPSFDISSGSKFTSLKSGTSTSIQFNNVPNGTYYVAIAAYNSSTTVDSTTNITDKNTSSGYTNITSSSTNLGRFAISTSGGDSPSFNGVVTIADKICDDGRACYGPINNNTPSLEVTLTLAGAIGATIDSTITITNGSSTIPSSSME